MTLLRRCKRDGVLRKIDEPVYKSPFYVHEDFYSHHDSGQRGEEKDNGVSIFSLRPESHTYLMPDKEISREEKTISSKDLSPLFLHPPYLFIGSYIPGENNEETKE